MKRTGLIPWIVSLACAGMVQSGCETAPAKAQSPEVIVGESLEQVRQAFSLTTDPEVSGGHSSYRLQDRGIWIFLNNENKVYTVRLDAPYAAPVHGIRIGDSRATLNASLGEPKTTLPSVVPHGGYIYEFESSHKIRYDFDATDKVNTIFVLSNNTTGGQWTPPPRVAIRTPLVPRAPLVQTPQGNSLSPDKVAAVEALRDYIQQALNQPKYRGLDEQQRRLALPFAAWAATLLDAARCPDTAVFALFADTYMFNMGPIGRAIRDQPESYKNALVDAVMEIEAARPPPVDDLTGQICTAGNTRKSKPTRAFAERKEIRELIAASFARIAGMSSEAAAVERFPEIRVAAFNPHLEVNSRARGQGHWLDSNRLITAAMMPDAHDIPESDPNLASTRVVLVDFRKRSVATIQDNVAIWDFDEETHDFIVAPGPFGSHVAAKQLHVNPDGAVVTRRVFQPGEQPPWSWMEVPKGLFAESLPLKSGGYFLREPGFEHPDLRNRPVIPTEWVRPHQPTLKLDFDFGELGPTVTYVAFRRRYLLHSADSRGNSATDGSLNFNWNRPYALTPYRLLGLDGSLEEIPYPREFELAGIKRFEELVVTRAGLAVLSIEPQTEGLFLRKDQKVVRIRGDSKTTGIEAATVSPDGCRIAYTFYAVPEETITGQTPRELAIVDVCKELPGAG